MPTVTVENPNLAKLNKNYRKTTNAEIRNLLDKIVIVEETNKGKGSVVGYYTADDETMTKIRKTPRNVSHTFDFKPNKLVKGLKEFKRITFLVKSSSRFFLKPDIGEVFDQMSEEDKTRTKAICNIDGSEDIPCDNLDQFLCVAALLE